MKVLQIVENLHRGSVERWLVRSYLHGRRLGLPLDWTFYCNLPERGDLEQTAERADARVVHSPAPLNDKRRYLSALRKEIKSRRYDIVHSHHDFVSAFYYVASIGGGARRIVHVHNTDEILPTSPLKRALLLEPMRALCLATSDRVLATSEHALRMFLAGRKPDPLRHRVHYCSVELDRIFATTPDRGALRAELGLEPEAKLLLFVGGMIDLKNPVWLVEMLPHLLATDPHFAAVFIGAGPEEQRVKSRADNLNVANRVRVLGWREDVPLWMAGSDVFVNPRRAYPPEGLGLVNVEAQAAGLRMLVSDGISPEPLLEGTTHLRLPLALGPEKWAKAVSELLQKPVVPARQTREILTGSPFNPDFAIARLHDIYSELQ